MTKYRVGDAVTLHAEVLESHLGSYENRLVVKTASGKAIVAYQKDIATHTPAPIKVGDKVTFSTYRDVARISAVVLAIAEGHALVRLISISRGAYGPYSNAYESVCTAWAKNPYGTKPVDEVERINE